jgi:hypothetical protein
MELNSMPNRRLFRARVSHHAAEAPMTIIEPTDGGIFLSCLEQVLVPSASAPAQAAVVH